MSGEEPRNFIEYDRGIRRERRHFLKMFQSIRSLTHKTQREAEIQARLRLIRPKQESVGKVMRSRDEILFLRQRHPESLMQLGTKGRHRQSITGNIDRLLASIRFRQESKQ